MERSFAHTSCGACTSFSIKFRVVRLCPAKKLLLASELHVGDAFGRLKQGKKLLKQRDFQAFPNLAKVLTRFWDYLDFSLIHNMVW